MTAMLVLWGLLATLAACGFGWTTYKLGSFVIDLEDEIDTAIDVVESCKLNLESISKMEVMMDEPVVRQALDGIASSRDALMTVSTSISNFSTKKQDNDQEP